MILYRDVAKSTSRSKTSEIGAILDAKNIPPYDWKAGDGNAVEQLEAQKSLGEAIQRLRYEVNSRTHESLQQLKDTGVFCQFEVKSHRGYWRVCFDSKSRINVE